MAISLTDHALPEKLPDWGVLVLESHHSPQFEMEWRTHPFVKVVYVLRGCGRFHLGGKNQTFSAGDVILIAPQIRNRIVDDPGSAASLYVCCMATSLFDFDTRLLERLPTHILVRDGQFANRVASLLRRLVHWQDSTSRRRPAGMVADALKLMITIDQRNEQIVQRTLLTCDERALVQAYLDSLPSRFFDETTIDAAARQLDIPRRTFTKLFTELAGETWLHRVRRLAIDHAKRRLQHTELPIASIAFECGFNDLSTFYRQFKTQTGQSPGQYRNQHEAS
ncbi:MAG: AraC family transcriptional regulator [Planctomycetota bacterium]|nr:AraC family transcriptional regulator [Planctomycetota bacterium]